MNTINISDEQYRLFCFLVNKITVLRESIPWKTYNIKDYKNHPEKCGQIVIIIEYIQNTITKNKGFLKKKIGTAFEYFSIWMNNVNIQKEYKKLIENGFIETLLREYSSTHNNMCKHKFKDFKDICNKYIENSIERERIYNLLNSLSENNKHNILTEIGSIFPRYILNLIFKDYFTICEFRRKLEYLNIPKYWTKDKMRDHGKNLGENKRQIKYKTKEFELAVSKFKISNSDNKIISTKFSIENIIEQIQKDKEISPILNVDQIVKYFWFLKEKKLSIKKIINILGISISNYYRLIFLFQTIDSVSPSTSTTITAPATTINIAEEPKNNKKTSNTNQLISVLPNGDIQVIFKYGSSEHKKYLYVLNEKLN